MLTALRGPRLQLARRRQAVAGEPPVQVLRPVVQPLRGSPRERERQERQGVAPSLEDQSLKDQSLEDQSLEDQSLEDQRLASQSPELRLPTSRVTPALGAEQLQPAAGSKKLPPSYR